MTFTRDRDRDLGAFAGRLELHGVAVVERDGRDGHDGPNRQRRGAAADLAWSPMLGRIGRRFERPDLLHAEGLLLAEGRGSDVDVAGVVGGVRLDRELVAVLEGDQEEVRDLLEHAARVAVLSATALVEVVGGTAGDGP